MNYRTFFFGNPKVNTNKKNYYYLKHIIITFLSSIKPPKYSIPIKSFTLKNYIKMMEVCILRFSLCSPWFRKTSSYSFLLNVIILRDILSFQTHA
jgi:hypothetical protein